MLGLVQTPPPQRAPGTDRLGSDMGLEWDRSGPAPSLGDHGQGSKPSECLFLICQTEIRLPASQALRLFSQTMLCTKLGKEQ